MKRILIVSAHPDDDILGCGGVMAKHAGTAEFRVIFIGEGTSCRYPHAELNSDVVKKAIDQRNDFGRQALSLLGIENVTFFNKPCGRLDQVHILEINKIIESEISSFEPDTIFTHSASDVNNDHGIVHRSTLMATRPTGPNSVSRVYGYEVLSSSEWRFTESFLPNVFEKLDEGHVMKKWKALEKYKSEVRAYPYPRSWEGIEALAKYRGIQSGNAYAEAFTLIREIRK